MKTVHVAAAVIIKDNKVLCVQRNSNKLDYISQKWEFPGGKVEKDEEVEETIVREIIEELNLNINVERFLVQIDHQYPDFRLIMDTFICGIESGELKLNEHIDFKWLDKEELNMLDWAAADIPVVNELIKVN